MIAGLLRSSRTQRGILDTTRRFAALPALHTPLPSAKSEVFVEPQAQTTNVTTLDGGVRVATREQHGNSSSLVVLLNAGSRDETFENNGSSHILQHMAFKTSANRSTFRITRELERLGATVQATAHRDVLMLSGDVLRPGSNDLLRIMAESLTSPALLPWEVEEAASQAYKSTEANVRNPPMLVAEYLHNAAYHSASLGLPLLPRKAQYDAATPDQLRSFLASRLSGSTVCVSGVNVKHDDVVSAVQELFASLPQKPAAARAAAQYSGGEVRTEADTQSSTSLETEQTTVAVAFEGVSASSPDLVPVCILQLVLGGGLTFSAGGPGKGMYTRLHDHIVGRYPSVHMAGCHNIFYADSGLFGVVGQCTPEDAGGLVGLMCDELKDITKPIPAEELTRAKNQLKCSVAMNLEERSIVAQDLARQAIAYNRYISGPEIFKMIDAVTPEQLTAVAQKLLKSPVTFVSYGDLRSVPRYEDVAHAFGQ